MRTTELCPIRRKSQSFRIGRQRTDPGSGLAFILGKEVKN